MPRAAGQTGWFPAGLALLFLALSPQTFGDPLSDARRLLQLTEAAREFELATRQQANTVIRTYASIVAMSTEQELPGSIKQEIARCYQQTYAWELFEPGIAEIFAANLSATELQLLIDFYNDKSVPPSQIDTFKALIARADVVEQMAIDYIFDQSEGCDARNVELILNFLAAQGS
jgi:hypothetical protein